MTIDTWESKEVALPAMLLFSNFPGYGGVELSGSFGFPGRRLERTSSETGNKAEEETTDFSSVGCRSYDQSNHFDQSQWCQFPPMNKRGKTHVSNYN